MPFFNPFREDRLRRMRELLGVLERQKEIDFDYILGWGGLRWGSTESSITSMLYQLEKARMIEILNNPEDTRKRTIKFIGTGVDLKEKAKVQPPP